MGSGEYSETYHGRRFGTFNALLPPGKLDILDFGCGSGENVINLVNQGHKVTACDVSPEMVEKCAANLAKAGIVAPLGVGGVEAMANLPGGSLNVVGALNVLPLLTEDEEAEFFRQSKRILRTGGSIVFSHTNMLVDIVTMNRYTVEFWREHIIPQITADEDERRQFGLAFAEHLTRAEVPSIAKSNSERERVRKRRINPISYPGELLTRHGLTVDKTAFTHYYPMPPQFMESAHPMRIFDFEDRMKDSPLSYIFASIVMMRAIAAPADVRR